MGRMRINAACVFARGFTTLSNISFLPFLGRIVRRLIGSGLKPCGTARR